MSGSKLGMEDHQPPYLQRVKRVVGQAVLWAWTGRAHIKPTCYWSGRPGNYKKMIPRHGSSPRALVLGRATQFVVPCRAFCQQMWPGPSPRLCDSCWAGFFRARARTCFFCVGLYRASGWSGLVPSLAAGCRRGIETFLQFIQITLFCL